MTNRKLNEDTAKKAYKYMYQAEFHVTRNRNVGKNVISKFLSLYKEVVEYEDQVVDDDDAADADDEVEDNWQWMTMMMIKTTTATTRMRMTDNDDKDNKDGRWWGSIPLTQM